MPVAEVAVQLLQVVESVGMPRFSISSTIWNR